MSATTSFEYMVNWADLDANGHMRNTAFFDYSAQTRFNYFESAGFSPKDFAANKVGPAALTETITYMKELRHGERFRVKLEIAGANAKDTRFEFVNTIARLDGTPCAQLRTMFVWLHLEERKAVAPPQKLLAALKALPKTDDFREL